MTNTENERARLVDAARRLGPGWAIAGGAALKCFGSHREANDLDLVRLRSPNVNVQSALERAFPGRTWAEVGGTSESVQSALERAFPGRTWTEVGEGERRAWAAGQWRSPGAVAIDVEVEGTWRYRSGLVTHADGTVTLSLEEIAAIKIDRLSRGEGARAKDARDLELCRALGADIERACALALAQRGAASGAAMARAVREASVGGAWADTLEVRAAETMRGRVDPYGPDAGAGARAATGESGGLDVWAVDVHDEYERFACTVKVEAVDEEDAWSKAYAIVRKNPRAQSWTMRPEAAVPDFDGFHRGPARRADTPR